MNTHDFYKEQMFAYLDEALEGVELAEMEQHLAACPECRDELAQARQLDGLIAELAPPALPDGFMDRLRATLRDEPAPVPVPSTNGKVIHLAPRRRTTPVSWGRVLVAAAACAAVVLVAGAPLTRVPTQDVAVQDVMLTAGTAQLRVGDQVRSVQSAVALREGEWLETRREGAVFLVGTGNEVRLAQDTHLQIARIDRDHSGIEGELALQRGRVYLVENNARLAVRTPQALITPVGTDYSISLKDGVTHVAVWEGRVRVQPEGSLPPVEVPEGFETTVVPGQPSKVSPIGRQVREDDWHVRNQRREVEKRPRVGAPLPVDPYPKADAPAPHRTEHPRVGDLPDGPDRVPGLSPGELREPGGSVPHRSPGGEDSASGRGPGGAGRPEQPGVPGEPDRPGTAPGGPDRPVRPGMKPGDSVRPGHPDHPGMQPGGRPPHRPGAGSKPPGGPEPGLRGEGPRPEPGAQPPGGDYPRGPRPGTKRPGPAYPGEERESNAPRGYERPEIQEHGPYRPEQPGSGRPEPGTERPQRPTGPRYPGEDRESKGYPGENPDSKGVPGYDRRDGDMQQHGPYRPGGSEEHPFPGSYRPGGSRPEPGSYRPTGGNRPSGPGSYRPGPGGPVRSK